VWITTLCFREFFRMQDLLQWLWEFEQHFGEIVAQQGGWTYLLLGMVVFLETGVVVLPFLPGDTLLFAVGSYAGQGKLDPWLAISALGVAAVLGDSLGYALGCLFRDTLAQGKRVRLINPNHLRKTQEFYEKHGAKTIMLARFVPVVRAFAPFCAGLARMPYGKMVKYSILGSVLWVGGFIWAGYFFGQIPLVKQYFPLVAMGIIGLTTIGVIKEVISQLRSSKSEQPVALATTPVVPGGPHAAADVTAADRPSPTVSPER
jgi:membrane-associated protein